MMSSKAERERQWALYALCLAMLMIVLDTTIVNVALPSIRSELGFTETSLVWVVNAYMVTFGGFLMLSGRLGDLFGQQRVFLAGIVLFTVASLGCGLAPSPGALVVARAAQGLGGAVVAAVALSLIMNLFTEPGERAKAMGIYSFVCACGGSLGVLLGGVLTSLLSWHWIFLVNLPIGIAAVMLCRALIPPDTRTARQTLDWGGAATITMALLLAVYAVVDAEAAGWLSAQTLTCLGAATVMLALFIGIESRISRPLVPLVLFKHRNLTLANMVGVLWAAAMFGWFFMSALYMQQVLGFTPMQVGLSFLPANVVMAVMSLSASARIVNRWGTRRSLAAGLWIAAGGLALFARAPVHGSFLSDVLPAMVLLGVGAGMAFNPLLLAAMEDAGPQDSGLASGLVNTSRMLGGALGLALLASIAAARAAGMHANGAGDVVALAAGYELAFTIATVLACIAGVLAWRGLRDPSNASRGQVVGSH